MTAMKAINKRTKIPNAIEGQLLYLSDFKCCKCGREGDHIHHLDGKPNNNILDNLAFLCFNCHNQASAESPLKKKLTKVAIIKFRTHHYQVIKNRRNRELGVFDRPIAKLTNENLLTVAKNAIIILKLEDFKVRYFSASWSKRNDIIDELGMYANHSNNRLAYEILEFLSSIASQTRSGMTEKVALSVYGQIRNFSPPLHEKRDRKEAIELAKQCIHIGFSMAYDSFIHLRKINIAMYGLTILKFIYMGAKNNKITGLKKEVEKSFRDLESTLKRPERNDLIDAVETLQLFRDDLNVGDLAFPVLTDRLKSRLDNERNLKTASST